MKKAFIQLHIAVFLAGFTAILGKLINLNEVVLVWYRLLITVVSLIFINYFFLLKNNNTKINIKQSLPILLVGAIIGLHWVTFYGSIKYANISVALVCLSASGFFTSLIEPFLLKQKIKFTEIALGLLAIIGIYIIFDFHPQFKKGIFFGIAAAILSALFTIYNKKLILKYTSTTLTFLELTGGLITISLLLPFYVLQFKNTQYLPSTSDWFYLLILSWVCTILCFNLQLNALKKISAFTVNLTYNLEPIYGIILAFIFFKENKEFNYQFYIGVALIILAVIFQMIRVKLNHKTNSK